MRRVVVTGLGVITCIGTGKDAFWEALAAGKSGVRKITTFDASGYPAAFAGEVTAFPDATGAEARQLRRMDRFTQFAFTGARMALADSRLMIGDGLSQRAGVVIGTSIAGLGGAEKEHTIFSKEGWRRISPFTVAAVIPANAASQVSIALGINGPSLILSTACASATDAIGYARQCIQSDEADVMLCGGTEAPINPFALGIFSRTGVLSRYTGQPQHACRPFDRLRDGMVLGEGAGILVLEELSHAQRRAAHIYAEVAGYGRTSDCYHTIIQEPTGRQAARAMLLAMKDAGVGTDEVDYINAHGSSTVENDKLETRIVKEVFGSHAYRLALSATKSMIGHLQGGCGGPESVATVLAIDRAALPPTANYEHRDPDCDLDYVPNVARSKLIRVALKNSFGFGGKNASIIFKRFE